MPAPNNKNNDDRRYHVTYVPITSIRPSPENDQLYGPIDLYDDMSAALEISIDERGLAEPLILTVDGYILSGHRRFAVCKDLLHWEVIPCRTEHRIRREGNPNYFKDLIAYNPQRVKSVGALLREAILRDSTTLEDTQAAIARVQATNEPTTTPDYITVPGYKNVEPVSESQSELLEAVQDVVARLKEYWPLSIRQIHYQLLNDPPLWRIVGRSQFDPEHYRYRNDDRSYNALSRLCVSARYAGELPWPAIDDTTRTYDHRAGFRSVSEFITYEMERFLLGYHRDKQFDQPVYLEVLIEKNTLLNITRPVCREYYVPVTSGRGFAGPSVWYRMANRFAASKKERMVLLVVSDYDPEGLALARDAIRSLRDLWEIPIDYHRVALTREQIDEQELYEDFNPPKEKSKNLDAFIEETGSARTWECEALDPEYLRQQLRGAIEANMNMEIFHAAVSKEIEDSKIIHETRNEIARGFLD